MSLEHCMHDSLLAYVCFQHASCLLLYIVAWCPWFISRASEPWVLGMLQHPHFFTQQSCLSKNILKRDSHVKLPCCLNETP